MFLELPDFLNESEVAELRAMADSGDFGDGLATAPGTPREIKDNEQLRASEAEQARLTLILRAAMQRSLPFQNFAQVARIRAPLLSRYKPGMKYERHLDAPILFGKQAIRSDLSMTIFLSDPGTYDGGALMLETDFGQVTCRQGAGGAVCYSTLHFHQVQEVTRGERLALVTWFQSRIRDPQQRALLFDVCRTIGELSASHPDHRALNRLRKIQSNMIRLWSDL
ncbi:MAG: Fe2+-dependent dioxygenase [Pseudomonadota bacterium]